MNAEPANETEHRGDEAAAARHRVLVVDDSPQILQALGDLLRRKGGYHVSCAESGEEALELVQREPPSLALLDVAMPGMNGFSLCRALRQDPRLADVPVVFLTGRSSPDDTIEGFHAGAIDYLPKPFDRHVVLERVQVYLRFHEALLRRRETESRLERERAERERIEVDLRHAQKLEAVGQLAAGIAHEINTPTQYVGDSVHFLKTAFDDLLELVRSYREAGQALAALPGQQAWREQLAEAEEDADLEYLLEHVPRAFERTFDGIDRVSSIVLAMKEFGHPDQREKSPSDLNKAMRNTLTVARNEYKYVADVETDLQELPLVVCHVGDINQVFLNLIVNAAHAIADAGQPERRGQIRIASRQLDHGRVRFSIADTGTGIPEPIRERIFEPFFTTKEVGKGTGQGLAIARSIVVDKHGGELRCDSTPGEGTTFEITLPVEGGGGQ